MHADRMLCRRGVSRQDRIDDRHVFEHLDLGPVRTGRQLELVAHALRMQAGENL